MSRTIWDDPAGTTAIGVVLLATFFMLLYLAYSLCCRKERPLVNILTSTNTKSILKKNRDFVFTAQSPLSSAGLTLYVEPHSSHPPVPPQITQYYPYAPQGPLVLEPPIIQVNTRA